jgi:hypothetical protein
MTAQDLADDLRYFLAESPVPVSVPPAALTPIPTRTTPLSEQRAAKIVPKGLRSFDAHDADFFLELRTLRRRNSRGKSALSIHPPR